MSLIAWMQLYDDLGEDVSDFLGNQQCPPDDKHRTVTVATAPLGLSPTHRTNSNPNGLIARFGTSDQATRAIPVLF